MLDARLSIYIRVTSIMKKYDTKSKSTQRSVFAPKN